MAHGRCCAPSTLPASIAAIARGAEGRRWLLSIQNGDGGWGEDGDSYRLDYNGYEPAPSTASQTSWALLGLMAAGEIDHPAVERGIDYLVAHQAETASGTKRDSPRRAFRASSICAITAIRSSSRFGRWRALQT